MSLDLVEAPRPQPAQFTKWSGLDEPFLEWVNLGHTQALAAVNHTLVFHEPKA